MPRIEDLIARMKRADSPPSARPERARVLAATPDPSTPPNDRPGRATHPTPTIVQTAPALFERTNRLFVPAYGFTHEAPAAAFIESVGKERDREPRTVVLASRGAKIYIGRDHLASEDLIDLVPFGNRPGLDRRYHQPWLTIDRAASRVQPNGAYNVLLLVEGRRTVSFYGERKRAAPWVASARSGPWEMAVAWERGDGAELIPVDEDIRALLPTRIYATRSARGVIIARRARISPSGEIAGFVTEVWLVKLEVLDHNSSQDDVVRPNLWTMSRVEDEEVDPFTYKTEIPGDAILVFNRAAEIFHLVCGHGVPPAIARKLEFFRTQNAQASGPGSYMFREAIQGLGYMDALDAVQEPWQLAIVVGEHGYSSELAEEPMSFTKGETTAEMLRRYEAARPAERGELVNRWMTEYVYPTTDMWNYTGD